MTTLVRASRTWKAAALVALGAVVGGGALALAAVPGGDDTIHACLDQVRSGTATVPDTSGPNLVIIDPGAGQHCTPPDSKSPNQREITWSRQGPTGPAGAAGPVGPAGTSGTAGPAGTGTTTTVQLSQVKLKPKAASLGTVKLGSLTFPILAYTQIAAPVDAHSSGKAELRDLLITKKVDRSSARLFASAAQGKRFPVVTLVVAKKRKKAGLQREFLRVKLYEVYVRSVQSQPTGTGSATQPLETLTLEFTSSSTSR